jgi:two-component system chemotaxis response regulator CheY
MKVLIADDSAFMRAILKDIVFKSNVPGIEVIEAGDGNEAVEKYKAEQPDLLFLDIIMPEKDGIGVLKEIGHGAKSIIVVSSVDQEEVINEAKSLGASDYILKPFDANHVIEILKQNLPQ